MISYHLLQAEYWKSALSFASAINLIDCKLYNMTHILNSYLPYRLKNYPQKAQIIYHCIAQINKNQKEKPLNRNELLLLEAKSATFYWQAFSIIINKSAWKRIYPHARDKINILLNIGYTMLYNFIFEILKDKKLSLEIGILHKPISNNNALIYDFEELFRQPVIDMCLISYLSRKNSDNIEINVMVNRYKKFLNENKYWQKGQWLNLKTLINFQANKYIKAITSKQIFIPDNISFAHRIKK